MHIRKWIIASAILVAALSAAFLIPVTRQTARFVSTRSATMLSRDGYDSSSWSFANWDERDRFLREHRNDAVMLLGMMSLTGHRDLLWSAADAAAGIQSSDPALHVGIIRAVLPLSWTRIRSSGAGMNGTPEGIALLRSQVDWGLKHDPRNALFPLLSSSASLAEGDSDAAVARFHAAVRRPEYRTYITRQREAVLDTLEAAGIDRAIALSDVIPGLPGDTAASAVSALVERMAGEAQKAEMEGRREYALDTEFSIFQLGRLMSRGDDSLHSSLWVMLRSAPKIGSALQGATMEDRIRQVADHMRSHGLSEAKVRHMSTEMSSVYDRIREDYRSPVMLFDDKGWMLGTVLVMITLAVVRYLTLALATFPFAKWLVNGDVSPRGWSPWTSAVLWILLLTPVVPPLLTKSDAAGLGLLSLAWFGFQNIGPNGFDALVIPMICMLAVVALSVALSCAVGRFRDGNARLLWIVASGIVSVIVLAWLTVFSRDDSTMTGLVVAVITPLPIVIFSLLRGWIVNRRAPGRGFRVEFATSLLASFRSVTIGSAVLVVAGIYLASPMFNRSIQVLHDYMMKGL